MDYFATSILMSSFELSQSTANPDSWHAKLQLVIYVICLQDYDDKKGSDLTEDFYKTMNLSLNRHVNRLIWTPKGNKYAERIGSQANWCFRRRVISPVNRDMAKNTLSQKSRELTIVQIGCFVIDMDIYCGYLEGNGSKCHHPSLCLGHERVLEFIWQRAGQFQHFLFGGICHWTDTRTTNTNKSESSVTKSPSRTELTFIDSSLSISSILRNIMGHFGYLVIKSRLKVSNSY